MEASSLQPSTRVTLCSMPNPPNPVCGMLASHGFQWVFERAGHGSGLDNSSPPCPEWGLQLLVHKCLTASVHSSSCPYVCSCHWFRWGCGTDIVVLGVLCSLQSGLVVGFYQGGVLPAWRIRGVPNLGIPFSQDLQWYIDLLAKILLLPCLFLEASLSFLFGSHTSLLLCSVT